MARQDDEPRGAAPTPQPWWCGSGEPRGHVRVFKDEGCLLSLSSASVRTERHAASICFALGERPLELRQGARVHHAAIAAWAPFLDVHLDTGGEPFACIDLLPTHPACRAFRQLRGEILVLPQAGNEGLLARLRSFHLGHMAAAEAYGLFRRGVELVVAGLPAEPAADPRVRHAVWRLHQQPALAPEALAREVGLSPDRLSRLFAQDMGFPMRRYVQALKVVAAGRYFGSGKSLTEIAVAAGFADLAHFSKVWRRCYGMPPAYYFRSGAVRAWPPDAPPLVLWEPGAKP